MHNAISFPAKFQSLAGVIIIHARNSIREHRAVRCFNPSRESSSFTRGSSIYGMPTRWKFQSLAGVIIIHAPVALQTTKSLPCFNPSRESSSFTRGSISWMPTRWKFQSLAGVIIIHAHRGLKRALLADVSIPRGSHHHSRQRIERHGGRHRLVSIPRGSHHHSRPSKLYDVRYYSMFQSLAGVIIIHAPWRCVRRWCWAVFQSLAGVIIIHAWLSASMPTVKCCFNPSRESSSFTPTGFIRLTSVVAQFQSLAGVIIIHAAACRAARVCGRVSIPRGSHHHSR